MVTEQRDVEVVEVLGSARREERGTSCRLESEATEQSLHLGDKPI